MDNVARIVRDSYREDDTLLDKLDRALGFPWSDVNATYINDETALMYAAQKGYTKVCGLLLERGANPNVRDHDMQWPALLYAVCWGGIDVCRMLLDAGADVNAQWKFGGTVLMAATERESTDICRLLIEHNADPLYSYDSARFDRFRSDICKREMNAETQHHIALLDAHNSPRCNTISTMHMVHPMARLTI